MKSGHATPAGTSRYAARIHDAASGHFRAWRDLRLSSIGLGTYLGAASGAADEGYEQALARALDLGCNVFDTAINYRHMRSERAIGKALARAFDSGTAARDEVFVSTKGGFVAFDGETPDDPHAYVKREYVDAGIAAPVDFVGGAHCMSPKYLVDQLDRSRRNLDLDTIDLYHVHNPEFQLGHLDREEFEARLLETFTMLEGKAADGAIRLYGTATWDGYRAGPDRGGRLSLARVLDLAREASEAAGTDGPHLGAIQLPLNLAMAEALVQPTQDHAGGRVSALAAASRTGLYVQTSASILQGRLSRGLPAFARDLLGGKTDAQCALQFARSAPGVTTALVGMASAAHVEENLELARIAPASSEKLRGLFVRGA